MAQRNTQAGGSGANNDERMYSNVFGVTHKCDAQNTTLPHKPTPQTEVL